MTHSPLDRLRDAVARARAAAPDERRCDLPAGDKCPVQAEISGCIRCPWLTVANNDRRAQR